MWEKVIPVQSIEQGCYISGNGDLSIGFDLVLPNIYTLSEEEAEAVNDGFNNLLKLLPVDTCMQKLDFFYHAKHSSDFEGANLITNENLKMYEGRPVLRHYSKLIFTFPAAYRKNTDKENSYLKLRDYIFQKPFRDFESTFVRLQHTFQTIESVLNSFIGAKRLDDEQLGRLLYNYLSQEYDREPKRSFREECIPPLSLNQNCLMLGGNYMKVVSLSQEGVKIQHHKKSKLTAPSSVDEKTAGYEDIGLKASLMVPLGLGFPVKHILSTVITVRDNVKAVKQLKMESTGLNLQASLGYSPAKLKQNEIKSYIETVEQFGYQCAELAVSVIIPASTEEKAVRYAELAKSAFMQMNGSRCWIENNEAANVFMTNCPGAANFAYRTFTTVTESAAAYLHKESQYGSDAKGFLFLDRSGAPCIIDLWDNPHIYNKNEIIVGGSGSGKSYLINTFVNQFLCQGAHVIIADIGNSSRRNTYINRGRHFDSSDRKSLCFNVFICERDSSGNWMYDTVGGEKDDGHISFIVTLVSAIWKADKVLEPTEKAVLRDIVECFYQWVNKQKCFPNMEVFWRYVETEYSVQPQKQKELRYIDLDSLLLMLRPYAVGDKKYLLNASANIDISQDRLVAFDLEAVQRGSDDFTLITLMMINLVIQKVAQVKGVKKVFYIDEMMDFIKDPKMGDFIAYLFRTFRKKEGKVVLAGQNVNFIKYAPQEIRDSILINCDIKILLTHQNQQSAFPDLQSALSLTDFDLELLESVRFKEFFIKTGTLSRVFQNEVSPFADAVFTSKQTEMQEIDRLLDKTGDLCAAVNQYVENRLGKTVAK